MYRNQNGLSVGGPYSHILCCHGSIELVKVKCGVRADVGPACNVVGYLDRTLLGINHLHPRPVYQRTPVCFPCHLKITFFHWFSCLMFLALTRGPCATRHFYSLQCLLSSNSQMVCGTGLQHKITRLWASSTRSSKLVQSTIWSWRSFKVRSCFR